MAKAKGEGKRRGHGEGSFRLTPSGKWEGAQWVGAVGKRVYATGETEKQARAKLAERVREVEGGRAPARLAVITFGDYALQVIKQRPGIGERTRDKYRTELRLYLEPLQDERVGRITAPMLRNLYADLRERGLSVAVQGHAHTLARLVLETARHDGLISRNPADVPGVRPRPERGADEPIHSYDRAQARRILAAAGGVTHGDLVAFLLLTGMRRGEAVGLKWDAVDFERGIAAVRETRSISGNRIYEGTPKTKQSRRDVPLTKEAVDLLHHVRAVNVERRAAFYAHALPSPYVFPSLAGTPQRPDNMKRTLDTVLDLADEQERARVSEAGGQPDTVQPLPRLRVHDLRHTFVSLAASSGVRLEVIARMIGDNPETVMRVYLHVFNQDVTAPSLGIGSFVGAT